MKAEVNKHIKLNFVSDLHLGSSREPNFLLFVNYLKSLKDNNVTHLFLLGDIFDLWVADHAYFIEQYKAVIEQIKSIVKSGIEVHYFEGNHDIHLAKYWQDTIGTYVYNEAQSMNVGAIKLHLAHGDQIDQEDIGYLRLRRFFRCWPMKVIAYCLPGFIVAKIGEFAGKKSKGHYLRENSDHSRIINLIRNYANSIIEKSAFDYCITGHFHIRDEYDMENGAKAINLGTWLNCPGYFEITNDSSQFVDLK